MTDDVSGSRPQQSRPPSTTGSNPGRVLGRDAPVVRQRFYANVTVAAAEGGFAVHLDGRGVRTPAKRRLVVPVRVLAEASAAEWSAQGAAIVTASMPVTQLACTAIDVVAEDRSTVAAEISHYAMSDLLCYRADGPAGLVVRQIEGWDPMLAWAGEHLGVTLRQTTGVMPVVQAPMVATAVVDALTPLDPFRLSAVYVLTTLTGSALLALAVLRERLTLDAAWQLAHIDDDWQITRWGTDSEAEARRAARLNTAQAAARVLEMLRVT